MATKSKQSQTKHPLAQVTEEQRAMTPKVAKDLNKATRARPGQPTKRTPEVVDEILDRIACGEALVNVCQDDHLPGYSTFNRWQREDRSLLEQVDIAYEFHARTLDDIADNWLAGGPGSTGDFRRDEARVGHLRYRLGKLNRRRFGDRQQVDVTMQEPFVLQAGHLPFSLQAPQVIDGEIASDNGQAITGPEADTPKPC